MYNSISSMTAKGGHGTSKKVRNLCLSKPVVNQPEENGKGAVVVDERTQGKMHLVISWEPPSNQKVDCYHVEFKPKDNKKWVPVTNRGARSIQVTSINMDGLNANLKYMFRVRTVLTSGKKGPWLKAETVEPIAEVTPHNVILEECPQSDGESDSASVEEEEQ